MPTLSFPPGVSGLQATYFGRAGGATARYYWVQPIYPFGRGPLTGPVLVTTVDPLTANDVVQLSWKSSPGAIAYDVLRNATGVTPTGTATQGLALQTTANGCSDRGQDLFSYTVIDDGSTPNVDSSMADIGALTAAALALTATARTATVDGTGTGTIAAATSAFVTVTSDNADKIIILPAPTPGRVVVLGNGATGYELRSSAPATVAINGGTGAGAESAIPADTLVVAICQHATSWKAWQLAADGTLAKVEAAA